MRVSADIDIGDPLDAFDAEDRRDEQRDRERRDWESQGTTISLTQQGEHMVPDDGAQLSEPERRFWRRCDTERRRQSARPVVRLQVQRPRRACQGSRRPRARRVRRAHAPPGDSSSGDDGPGEPGAGAQRQQHLAARDVPRPSAALRFAALHADRMVRP